MEYFLPIVKREEIADKTWAFWFSTKGKPASGWRFKAGQNADFGVGDVRTFSIASSPNDHKSIMIAARRMDGSDFKKKLMTMPLGEKIRVQGPFGDFVLPRETDRPIVMLAGGIGITPFLSMITYATEKELPYDITLYFANSAPKRATFLQELHDLQARNPNFKLHAVFERLNFETLKLVPNARYYVAGPPGFIAGARAILDGANVDSDNIRTEEFSGY